MEIKFNELIGRWPNEIINKVIIYLPRHYPDKLYAELNTQLALYAWQHNYGLWFIFPIEMKQSQLMNITLYELLVSRLMDYFELEYYARYDYMVALNLGDISGHRHFCRAIYNLCMRYNIDCKFGILNKNDFPNIHCWYIGSMELGGKKFIIYYD